MNGRLLVEADTLNLSLKIAVRVSACRTRLTLVLRRRGNESSNGAVEPGGLLGSSSSLASSAACIVLLLGRHLEMPWFFRR